MPLSLNDQLEQLSKAMVQAVCATAGVICADTGLDRISRDLLLSDTDQGGVNSFASVALQLKATTRASLSPGDTSFSLPLPIKNYNDLRARSSIPTLLVVALLPRDTGAWLLMTHEQLVLRGCLYWRSLQGEPDSNNTDSVTVRVPTAQAFTPAALTGILERLRNGGTP
jgi:hypothetical protein